MKKIFYLFILLFLFIPSMVLADSSSPSILGYDAVVTNKNGVKVEYDGKEITVKYNSKVHVYDEYDEDASCVISMENGGESEYYVSIPLKYLAPVKKEVVPKDLEKVNNQGSTLEKGKEEFIILNTKGIKLSKGPADVYGTYDQTIPFATLLHTTYYINTERSTSWYYVDSDGYKGWIDSTSVDYGRKSTVGFITAGKADLKDKDGNVVVSIPSETELSEIYFNDRVVYTKYDNKTGYVNIDDKFALGFKETEGYLLTINKTNIISIDGEVKGTIPLGEKVKILYGGFNDGFGDYEYHSPNVISLNENTYFYVEYNGVKGFVKTDNTYPLFYEFKEKNIDLTEERDFYDIKIISADLQENETFETFQKRIGRIEKIPKSATITIYSESYRYADNDTLKIELVKYKGKVGCITKIIKEGETESEGEPEATVEPIISTPVPTEVPTPKEKTDNMILYCIIGGVLLSFAALGTIIAINKKKKKNDVKEIKKEEPKKKEKTESSDKPLEEEPKKDEEKNKEV